MAKVLLVEDDNNLREIYQARLAAEGYEISSAQDGEEALVVAKQEKPDLVISDVMMPKISGFEMLDILRNTAGLEHVKVIMLTALGQSEDRDRADSLGADKYLVKSQVTLEDIVKTSHELLDGDAGSPEPAAVAAGTAAGAVSDPVTAQPVDDAPVATPPVEPPATPADNTAVADPVAAPADDTSTTATPDPATPTDQVQAGSSAQEEAVVQEQINSFVENIPAETPTEAPVESAPEPGTTTAEAEQQAVTSGDDQLMAAAANELASASETAETPVETPEEPPVEAPAEDKPSDEPENPDISTTTIAGKKVIQPLDSEPKSDIHDLLAKEEATVTAATGPVISSEPTPEVPDEPVAAPVQPGQAFTPGGSPEEPAAAPAENKPAGSGGIDPNSIAL